MRIKKLIKSFKSTSLFELLIYTFQWFSIALLIALFTGTASAFLLLSLESVTQWREMHHWLIWLLPIAGLCIGWIYLYIGQSVNAGNNLLIDEIHNPQKVVPLRMAPLIFVSTVTSHLFGASVGREGTAVQMGGALADQLTHLFRANKEDRNILLMMGMSAGFASIFGTPIAGAIFGLEVLIIGRIRCNALFPCVMAGILADQVALAWGINHSHYMVDDIVPVTLWSIFLVMIAGMIFGFVGTIFAKATHKLGAIMKKVIKYSPLRPFFGGIIIAVLVYTFDAYHYVGLGISDIHRAFNEPIAPWSFLSKLGLTVISLGTEFKGGEVTPLFYIGSTLGNALSPILNLPIPMLAGLGFVAVFSGAANTPITTTIMAIELFGVDIAVYATIACTTAYLFSGHVGIYHSQRIGEGKYGQYKDGAFKHVRASDLTAYRKEQHKESQSTKVVD